MGRTDELLYQMIPKSVADRLRKGESAMSTCQVYVCHFNLQLHLNSFHMTDTRSSDCIFIMISAGNKPLISFIQSKDPY